MGKNNAKNIWEWLFAVLKGTLVGLAVVIPGVSGGSMLLTIGVYGDAVSITSKDKAVRNKYGDEEKAIAIAKGKAQEHESNGNEKPSQQCPGTTMHLLVEEIKSKIQKGT